MTATPARWTHQSTGIATTEHFHNSLGQAAEALSLNYNRKMAVSAKEYSELKGPIDASYGTQAGVHFGTGVQQSATNAKLANGLALSARVSADNGAAVVNNAVNVMAEIANSSRKINSIIELINSITFQTNLLALNASVEAARAGDQGRGFAVVADEVRILAGRSAGAVKKVTRVVEEIMVASNEQADGIASGNAAVQQMDEMTQQNFALVEEAAANSESLGVQSDELGNMMEAFRV